MLRFHLAGLAPLVGALVLTLSACTGAPSSGPSGADATSSPAPTEPSGSPTAERPCAGPGASPQGAARLRPDTGPVGAAGLGTARLRSVLLPEVEGVCLVLDPGSVRPGWEVHAQWLRAQSRDRTWWWEQGSRDVVDGEGPGSVVVPEPGCVEVTASVLLFGPDGEAGAWTAEQTFGWGCGRAPGGRAVPAAAPR